MPTAGGPNTLGESNLVFAYDIGDTRNSYIGEPTTNIYSTDGYSFWQLNGNHTATRYTGNAPDLTTILNNYDYHTIVTTGNWSNEVDRALLWTNSGLLQLNTQYAVSFYARVISTSTANIGAAFYGNALPNSLTLTNQWQRFTVLTSTTATFRPFEFGSKSGAITFQVAGIQYEAKSHSTPYVNGTRSATQGLLPLIGNSTLDLTAASYDSTSKISLDGSGDYIKASQNSNFYTNEWTWEIVTKFTSNTGTYQGLVWAEGATGGGSGYQYLLSLYNNTYFHYRISNTATGWTNTNTANISFTPTNYNHIVWQFFNGTTKIYINGNLFHTDASRGGYNGGTDSPLYIGARNDGALGAPIYPDIFKMYNRALSAQEVKQNYQQYKTRFNLS